jgi:hypothetical protein
VRKTTTPPPDWKTFSFSRREFGRRLGIEGRIVRVSVILEVEIAMDSNPDGSRDYYRLSREELAGKLGLEGWRPFSAYAGMSKVEIRASPATPAGGRDREGDPCGLVPGCR